MARMLKLAVIPGDGIGPEVIAEAVKVLDAVTPRTSLTIDKTPFSLGADRYLATGDVLSDEDLAAIAKHDAILLGAVGGVPGDTRIPAGIIERGLLLKLRFSLDHYVNLRPTKLYPGVVSPLADPGKVDFVVVREGTEGPYVGNGGAIRVGTPAEVANEVSVNTAFGVERLVRYAFELASTRDRKKVTLVHKHNVLVHAGWLWQRTVNKVAEEFPGITHDYLHIDAATIFMVTEPQRFDVVVVTNYLWRALFASILHSLAPGGLLLYETFARGNERLGRPARSEFLLQPGELLSLCHGLQIVAYENGLLAQPARCVQRIAPWHLGPTRPPKGKLWTSHSG